MRRENGDEDEDAANAAAEAQSGELVIEGEGAGDYQENAKKIMGDAMMQMFKTRAGCYMGCYTGCYLGRCKLNPPG